MIARYRLVVGCLMFVLALLVIGVGRSRDVRADAAPAQTGVVGAVPGVPALRARDGRGGVCISFGGARVIERCGDPTLRDDDAAVTLVDGMAFGGVVAAGAKAVELVLADGAVLRATPQPAPGYRGRLAGRVAFFTVANPAAATGLVGEGDAFEDPDQIEVRVLGADGATIGVAGQAGEQGRTTGPARMVVQDRRAAGRLTVTVTPHSRLTPTVTQLEHRTPSACVKASLDRGGSVGFTRACFAPGGDQIDHVRGDGECAVGASTVVGLLPVGARRVVVTLGSGRSVTAKPFGLGPAAPDRRAFVLVVPGAEAVRRLEVDGAATTLARPPLRNTCVSGLGEAFGRAITLPATGPRGPTAQLTAPPAVLFASGAHRLVVADGPDQRLCFAVDRDALLDRDCTTLARGRYALRARVAPGPGGTTVVGGVVRESVPGVSVATTGRSVRAALGPVSTTGLYAGRLRPFLAVVPAGRAPIVVLAAGRPEVDEDGVAFLPGSEDRGSEPARLRRVGRLGRAVVWAAVRDDDPTRCAALTGGRRPHRGDFLCDERGSGLRIDVSCSPRRATVLALLRGRAASLSVETGAGRPSTGRALTIAPGLRLHVVKIPVRRGVRRIVRRRANGKRNVLRVALPPAAAQCGYVATRA